MKYTQIPVSTIAERLGAATHTEPDVEKVNILLCGWNNKRERRGLSRINFARRLQDENEWRKEKGLPPCTEKFMYPDEVELFSQYAGYDLRG